MELSATLQAQPHTQLKYSMEIIAHGPLHSDKWIRFIVSHHSISDLQHMINEVKYLKLWHPCSVKSLK